MHCMNMGCYHSWAVIVPGLLPFLGCYRSVNLLWIMEKCAYDVIIGFIHRAAVKKWRLYEQLRVS